MNLYIVSEGATEKTVFRYWIPLLNSNLSPVDNIQEIRNNHFYTISAKGFPLIFEVIDAAIQDINATDKFDRLIITVDSEDMTKEDKAAEMAAFVANKPCKAKIHFVIQHFCFETWPLGNRKIIRRNPQNAVLVSYKKLHDVRINDPELLPPNPAENLNRAQFAVKYLKYAIQEHGPKAAYSKTNPLFVCHPKYLAEMLKRLEDTGHIASFADFISSVT